MSPRARALTVFRVVYSQVAKHLGDVAVHFTKNNPTGHYVLDLSMKPQHDVCLRLVELQKHQVHFFGLAVQISNHVAAAWERKIRLLRHH